MTQRALGQLAGGESFDLWAKAEFELKPKETERSWAETPSAANLEGLRRHRGPPFVFSESHAEHEGARVSPGASMFNRGDGGLPKGAWLIIINCVQGLKCDSEGLVLAILRYNVVEVCQLRS